MIEKQTVGPFQHAVRSAFSRADLEIYGIDTFRPSYTTHVFLDDSEVPLDLPAALARESYAGCFSVFGHSRCVGDEGHCEPRYSDRRFDDRPSHPLTPAYRRVVVTEGLRRALARSSAPTLTVTFVSVTPGTPAEGAARRRLLDCKSIQIVTFR